jgi:hypothetical protein
MADLRESLPTDNRLADALRSELSPVIVARLQQVCERSKLKAAEVIAQAIDFAWHVEMSGELDRRQIAVDGQQLKPADELRRTPAVLSAEGSERPLTQVELGDIVKLRKPYQPVMGTDRQRGPFGFGIVAEIIHVLPDGRIRNVSLYLYDPERREIFLGPNGIAEFVDFHCSEFDLYKQATEQGYTPLVPRDDWARSPGFP